MCRNSIAFSLCIMWQEGAAAGGIEWRFLLYDRFTSDTVIEIDTAIQTAEGENTAAEVDENNNEIQTEAVAH